MFSRKREIEALERRLSAAERERWEALTELEHLREQVAGALGLHVERPYREDQVDYVTFPVFVSRYVLRELSKRMEERLLVESIEAQVAERILAMIHDREIARSFEEWH